MLMVFVYISILMMKTPDIKLQLYCTFLAMIKRCRGRYTPQQLERCGKMVSGFGKEFGTLFQSTLRFEVENEVYNTSSFITDYEADVVKFVRTYTEDELVTFVPDRDSRLLPDVHEPTLKSPIEMGRNLRKKSRNTR